MTQPLSGDSSAARRFLTRLGPHWARQAAVKNKEPSLTELLEPAKPDFAERLLPFRDHPTYQGLDEAMKRRVLSCGWLIYNERVVRVELDVVNPVCNDVLLSKLPGATSQAARESMAQALVDEAYHILLVVRACRLTREQRGLEDLRLPVVGVVRRMHARQASCAEAWQRDLVQLMTGVATEMCISRYLSLLSTASEIQAFNRVTTALHQQDEASHVDLFGTLARDVFNALEPVQQEFVREILPLPWLWFSEGEADVWRSVLLQLGIPRADVMMDDCIANKLLSANERAMTDAQKFSEALGIDNIHWDRAAALL
ncbi:MULTISPECIES: diiron oxygenase [Myxococcus]|uniref:diiron oxygenase n=1 Tax=Myxococcus TaxID=32 RepID=UPI000312C63D|nr:MULTISPECIES: diiron oxygenase [Myxococcus]NOJ56424.1 hypothetical protein [Myxococcus xanthus]QPM80933.1 diiron oxygenase [Myxococcus xanthus]QVW69993.1 diiron oxygenase [Myxococcus xanthus DZ2]QZZ48822.1 Non-heme di-iron N-oxygenase [Myxococcus xanthus]UEO03878.1 diiron oxygenase [Myxococcus xanthus DZ2]